MKVEIKANDSEIKEAIEKFIKEKSKLSDEFKLVECYANLGSFVFSNEGEVEDAINKEI